MNEIEKFVNYFGNRTQLQRWFSGWSNFRCKL